MAKNNVLISKILECDPAKFQKVCDSYFRENGYPNIISYGLTINGIKTKKGTPDSHCVNKDGAFTFFEYTTEQGDIGGKLNKDIDKCISHIKDSKNGIICKTIIFVASSNDLDPVDLNEAQKKCEANSIRLEVICLNQLCTMLIKKGKRIIEDEFGLAINASPVCSIEEFVERNSKIYGNDFKKSFYGRETDIKNLSEKVQFNDAVVVCGDSGVGKTRLVIEYLKKQVNKVLIVQNRSGDISHDLLLEIDETENPIVFFDDANGIPQLKQVIEDLAGLNRKIKMIFSVRNYAKPIVLGIISQFKKMNYDELCVSKLENTSIKNIIESNYGIINPKYQERIITIANGNSRLAVIASEKILKNSNSVSLWNDSASLLNDYYSEIIKTNSQLDYENNKKILCVLAILEKIDLQNEKEMKLICSFIGVSHDDFIDKVFSLYRFEILDIYLNRVVRVSDQCLKDYFIYDGFIKSKFFSLKEFVKSFFYSYRKRVINSINMLVSVYTSEPGNEYLKNEIISLWDELERNGKISDEFIASFSLVDPNRGIQWVEKRIFVNQIKSSWKNDIHNQGFYSKNLYLEILEHVFCTNFDFNSIALIFESLHYDSLRKLAIDSIKRIASIQIDDFDYKFSRQHKLIEDLLMVKDEDYFCDVACLVAKELLKFSFFTWRNGKANNVEYCSFSINDEMPYCFDLRNDVWKLLLNTDATRSFDVIYHCLDGYSKSVRKLIINDLHSIERIMEKFHYDRNKEMLIYVKVLRNSHESEIEWNYIKGKYKDEMEDIELLFDLGDNELTQAGQKLDWEIAIQQVAEKDGFEKGIGRLKDARSMYLISNDYKLSSFVICYLSYCNDKIMEWTLSNLQDLVVSFGASIIYSIVKRVGDIRSLNEKLKLVESDELRDEAIACFINYCHSKDEKIKRTFHELISKDFQRVDYVPIIGRKLDKVFELCDSNDEFCSIVSLINLHWDNSKKLCESYYGQLFNKYLFSIERLMMVFGKNVAVLEKAFLNYLPSKEFISDVSTYFFKLCELDSSFFYSALEYVLSIDTDFKSLSELWKQQNKKIYATTIFNYLMGKVENDCHISFFFANYFGLGIHSERFYDKSVLEWAKETLGNEVDSIKCKYLMKIVSETNSNYVLDFLAFLINKGISNELFESLRIEPQIVSYSGSQVPQIEKKIKFYNDLINLIDNKMKQRTIVATINERISSLEKYIIETKIKENIDED